MSVTTKPQTQKSKQKIKILLKVEKGVNGLVVNVKSKELSKLSKDFYSEFYSKRDISYDYLPNPNTIIYSMNWYANYPRRNIISGNKINLTILNKFRLDNINEYTMTIENVFTNEEIRTYVEQFETMIMKMKQLLNEQKTLKQKIKKTLGMEEKNKVTASDLNEFVTNSSDISNSLRYLRIPESSNDLVTCSDPSCELCNETRNRHNEQIEQTSIQLQYDLLRRADI